MKVLTIESFPNKEYEVLSSVKGIFFRDFEVTPKFAIESATDHMISEAEQLGADAIIGMRYSYVPTSAIIGQVIVYGTAIKFIN